MFPYTHFSFLHHRKSCKPDNEANLRHAGFSDLATILMIEYRDEIYAAIEGELANNDALLTRVMTAGEAVTGWRQHRPELILINAEMPDESGFLISLKLRMHGFQGGLWLYSACANNSPPGFQQFCQIDHLFNYKGDLRMLTTHLNQLFQH